MREKNRHGGIPGGRCGSRDLYCGGRGGNFILDRALLFLLVVLVLVGAALAGRVRGLRVEAQDTADPQRLHRATVRLKAAEPGGLPPGILPEAREGELSKSSKLRIFVN